MAIELIREAFKVEELKGSNEIQALVETDIYLSPTKPNIEKLLWVQGKVEILNTKIIKDKLIISGLARFNVLYRSGEEENNIHSVDTSKEFREELDIEGIREDMISKIRSKIEYIEWDLEEARIQLKALVNLWGEVEEIKTIEAIKEIKAKDSLQCLKEKVNYKEVHGREISYALIKDVIRLGDDKPEIDEIVKFSIKTKEVESMVVDGRIITSGEAIVNIVYYGQNQIYSHKATLPFNHFVEMPGVNKDLKGEIGFEVVEGIYEVVGNELGERKLVDLEIKIRVTGKAYEEKSRELIIDAYSTKESILLGREEINIKESLKDIKHYEVLNVQIDGIDAKEILEIEGNTTILDKRYVNDDIVIEGILSLDIQYIDRISEELASYKGDFPFRSLIIEDPNVGVIIDVQSSLESIKHFGNKDSFGVEGSILLRVNLSKNRKIYGIREIKETNELIDMKNKPSITVYIVQKGDVLWDIAKRYNTTTEEILTSNSVLAADLVPGNKIIIEKKVEMINI